MNLEFAFIKSSRDADRRRSNIVQELRSFDLFGQKTRESRALCSGDRDVGVPVFVNEFWTARQRQASSLHEVSYRACFKPQLPRFFIERLTDPGEYVYDPFMGRGTTLIEAALLARHPVGNDINPLSVAFTKPRLNPPLLHAIETRLAHINFNDPAEMPEDLHAFYHPDTLRQISSLKKYLVCRQRNDQLDGVDEWIRMVAINRLTGHSSGFFSVYTLPPNQAVSIKSQRRINEKRGQTPPQRDVTRIILKKSRQLLADITEGVRQTLNRLGPAAVLLTCSADVTPEIPDQSISLIVTSPPFLNVVQYATDNWLRCWFLGIDAEEVKLTVPSKLADWEIVMNRVFMELSRILKPGGHVAFEVGEVHAGTTLLEKTVLSCGLRAGLRPILVLINDQKFTKTANCWGVENMSKGTNSNRIVLFQREDCRPPIRI